MTVEACLLRRRSESAVYALLHSRNESSVAELLPTLLRVVDRHNRPTAFGRPCSVKCLSFWQPVSGMNRGECRVILTLRAAGKKVNNSIRHVVSHSSMSPRSEDNTAPGLMLWELLSRSGVESNCRSCSGHSPSADLGSGLAWWH